MNVKDTFPKGVLRPELLMGKVNSVSASTVQVNFSDAGAPSGSYYLGGRYGKGEVGEFVIIEGQINLLLGRVVEVKVDNSINQFDNAFGRIQLLGSICMETLKVTAGVDIYPRLGDFVFAAPHNFVSSIPELMDLDSSEPVMLDLGTVDIAVESTVTIKPEKLFGRHLAILGSTGGGKSWTVARILEECMKYNSKIILIDATGEYRGIAEEEIEHWHLSLPVKKALPSKECKLPPTCFQESDFIALFEPSGKLQGPILREAIRSLRLSNLFPDTFPDGYIKKAKQSKVTYNEVLAREDVQSKIDNPTTPFDVAKLTLQIEQECVYPSGFNNDVSKWGDMNGNLTYCLSLLMRINGILTSPAFSCVFIPDDKPSLVDIISNFIASPKKLLRIDLSGIPFEYKAREIISNVIGRHLLNQSRSNTFQDKPLLLFLDEAHNFLGKNIGSDETVAKLDSFELIAKEGRKFGLNIILATQRPRDITEGVLSQIGTLIVHRLTNDRDREVVERACGEIDKAASSFLPNLKPGEAVIIGNDFPIPLTMQIHAPRTKPKSSGPDFQKIWRIPAYSHKDSPE